MNWTSLDTTIVVVGAVSAMACALLGCFLVLRQMSLMGDAISHAVLPGLAVAFLLTHSRSSWPMFVGAAAVGVLTALLTEAIRRFGRVDEGAAMGTVFTSLFALGLVLMVRGADHVDLDPGCVLYGAIELVPLDTVRVAGMAVPRALVMTSIVLAVDLAFVLVFYKELKITSFDPGLATTLGVNATVMHYALMVFVAVTTVAVFECVGSILVVAMLIVPAATAQLITNRMWTMLLVAMGLGAASAGLGHVMAITVPSALGLAPDTNTAGMMGVAAGLLFVVALLFSPRHGVVSRIMHRYWIAVGITREDILGMLFRAGELRAAGEAAATPIDTAFIRRALGVGPLMARIALQQLRRGGRLRWEGDRWGLTTAGQGSAGNIIRSHRLWETYLYRQLGLPPDHIHRTAEGLEHITHADLQEALAAATEHPTRDPHDEPVPPGATG